MIAGLRARAAISGALLIAFFALAFAVLGKAVGDLERAADDARHSDEVIATAYALRSDALDVQTAGRGYVITGEERFLGPLRDARPRIGENERRLQTLLGRDGVQPRRAAELSRDVDDYLDFTLRLVEAARRDLGAGAEVIRSGRGNRKLDAIRRKFDVLIATERKREAARTQREHQAASRARLVGAGALGLSVLVVLLATLMASRWVVVPVTRVVAAARRLAAGELGTRVEERGRGEVRELAQSFNTMARSLQENRDELESQNAELEAQQGELEYAVDELGRQKEGIEALHRFGELLASETELRPLAHTILGELCDLCESDVGTLYATDGEAEPALLATRGVDAGVLPLSLSAGEGLAGRALVERRSVPADYGETGLRVPAFGHDTAVRHEIHVPLVNAGQTFGVVTLGRLGDRSYPPSEVEVIEYMAGQAAVALSNALSLRRARDQAAINRAVVETAHDAFIAINQAGYITGWNSKAEETFGWSAAEAIGRELAGTIMPEELRERHRDGLARFVATGQRSVIGQRLELPALHRDGHTFPVEIAISPVRVGDAWVFNAFLHDISERTESQATVKRLADIVESADEAIMSVALDGTVTTWNSGAERALGWSAEEMIGRRPDDVMPRDRIAEEYELFLATAQAGETLRDFETVRIHKDGHRVHASLSVSPLRDANGRLSGISVLGTDISERKRLEQKSSRLFAISVDLLCTVDDQGRFLEVNPAWSEVLGWADHELIGRPFIDFVHPDDLERTRAQWAQTRATGANAGHFENRYRCRDGSWRWLSWKSRTDEDEGAVYAVARDVTEDRRAAEYAEIQHAVTSVLARAPSLEDAISEAMRTLGEALDWKAGAFWSRCADRGAMCCAELWLAPGFEAADFAGMTRELLFEPGEGLPGRVWESGRALWFSLASGSAGFPRWDAGVQAGLRAAVGVPVAGPSGVNGVLEFFSTRDREPDPELLAMLSGLSGQIGQFVERKRAEAEAERLKDEFFALVSHELRTPLSAIIGYLELLEEDETENLSPEGQRFMGVIDRNAQRLLRLVGDLLFVAQVEAGKLSLDPGRVDLTAAVLASVDSARPRAEEKQLHLTVDAERLPIRAGDGDRIGQALDNLISNAVKFTPEGGRVHVAAHAADGHAVIEVRDSGIGIPAAEQDRLFQRFYRASSAVDQAIPGVGLGLTIAAAIVEGHGGRINVQSAESEGTTFRIELPLDAKALRDVTPSADYVGR